MIGRDRTTYSISQYLNQDVVTLSFYQIDQIRGYKSRRVKKEEMMGEYKIDRVYDTYIVFSRLDHKISPFLHSPPPLTREQIREFRKISGMSYLDIAKRVGYTSRYNVIRWVKESPVHRLKVPLDKEIKLRCLSKEVLGYDYFNR